MNQLPVLILVVFSLIKVKGENIWSQKGKWASLVAQKGKNQPEMPETWVWSLGWENTLGTATHSSILAWRIPWTEKHSQAIVHGVAKSRTRLNDFQFHFKWKHFYVFKLLFSLFATKTFNGAYVCSILGNIFYVVDPTQNWVPSILINSTRLT